MLTSFSWVPKGAMRPTPLLSSDTVEEAHKKLQQLFPREGENEEDPSSFGRMTDAKGKRGVLGSKSRTTGKKGTVKSGKKMTHYKEEEVEEDEDKECFREATNDTLRDIAGGGAGAILEQMDSDDEDEIEDRTFKETDLVFAVAVADDGANAAAGSSAARLELYTYDEVEDNLFIHHDMDLGAFPLSTAWLTDGVTSLMAVGTMLPLIEIWALDVMDSVAPMLCLGGCEKMEDNYVQIKKKNLKPESHTDAVLTVAWNSVAQNILVSGSADHSIKIWDLNQTAAAGAGGASTGNRGGGGGVCLGTYRESEKVQSVCFHRTDPNMLLSGGFDGIIRVRDCRHPEQNCHQMSMNGEVVEHVEFVPETSLIGASEGMVGGGGAAGPVMQVMGSTSHGTWAAFDLRQTSQPLWSFRPHSMDGSSGGVSTHSHAAHRPSARPSTEEVVFSCSLHVPGLAATGGKNGFITLWDCRHGAPFPESIVSRDYKTGGVLSMAFHPNSPHILGACGMKGEPLVYTMINDLKGRW